MNRNHIVTSVLDDIITDVVANHYEMTSCEEVLKELQGVIEDYKKKDQKKDNEIIALKHRIRDMIDEEHLFRGNKELKEEIENLREQLRKYNSGQVIEEMREQLRKYRSGQVIEEMREQLRMATRNLIGLYHSPNYQGGEP
jgi:hypothetical protein